jgi:magnesium-transporting ATPase (P-type)
VRPEAREAVHAARAAGIRTIMITGDHLGTATAVARATGVLTDDDPYRIPATYCAAFMPVPIPAARSTSWPTGSALATSSR